MCLTPIYVKGQQYPCGKCLECQAQLQQDIMVLNLEESKKYNSIHFLTLTYSNDSVPITHTVHYIDKSTGELIRPISIREKCEKGYKQNRRLKRFVNGQEEKIIRAKIHASKNSVYQEFNEFEDCIMVDSYFFSLRREDVKLWLKRVRTDYFRKFGENLNFSFYGAGEYGSDTFRPHYHYLFYGLTDAQANFMTEDWKKNKGFVCCKPISKLKSVDVAKVSNYVAKYIVKPMESFKNGFTELTPEERINMDIVEKPRRQGSLNFGISKDFEKIFDDLTQGLNQEEFTEEDVNKLVENNKNIKYHYNGNLYRIPTKLKKRTFFRKNDFGRLQASPLRKAVVDAMALRHVEDDLRQFRKFQECGQFEGQDIAMVFQAYYEAQKEDRKARYYIKKDNVLRKYNKSKIR